MPRANSPWTRSAQWDDIQIFDDDGNLANNVVSRESLSPDVQASTNAASHNVLRTTAKRAKGGVIGTGGKIAVAIRVDHGVDQFLSGVWPLLKARGMPCSIGINPDAIGHSDDSSEPTTTTWAQLYTAHKEGFEVWSHCSTHLDPALTGNSLEYEIARSKTEIESHGFVVNGITSPGITPCLTPDYSINFGPNSWTTHVGQLYLGNYGLIEASGMSGGAVRYLPTDGCYDLGHYTLDGMTQSQAQQRLDAAIAAGQSIEFMLHPYFIVRNTVTMTVAALTGFLDYLQTKRNAGLVEIVTATGLAFADDGTAKRVNLLQDGGFEVQSTVGAGTTPWLATGSGITINTDGGKTGSKYAHIPAASGSAYVYQGNGQLANLNALGQTFVIEAWARCVGADTEARVYVVDSNDVSKLLIDRYWPLTVAGGWTKIRVPFTVPKDSSGAVQVRLYRRLGSGDVDWDDVGWYPV